MNLLTCPLWPRVNRSFGTLSCSTNRLRCHKRHSSHHHGLLSLLGLTPVRAIQRLLKVHVLKMAKFNSCLGVAPYSHAIQTESSHTALNNPPAVAEHVAIMMHAPSTEIVQMASNLPPIQLGDGQYSMAPMDQCTWVCVRICPKPVLDNLS
jgi:hypothetical protein